MARGVSLRRYEEVQTFVPNYGASFRVRIEAYDNEGMPKEVFLFQKRLVDPWTGLSGEDFCAVCAPDDLVVYPANEPNPTQMPAFYRKAEIDVLVASRRDALAMWEAVRQQVCVLVDALDRKDVLRFAETVRCGDAIDDESASASASA